MRGLIFIFLAVFALAGEIRIATFNVQNLFDGQNNGNEYDEFKIECGFLKCSQEALSKIANSSLNSYEYSWNEQKYQKYLKKISDVLGKINADIISLNEIENENVLKELAQISGYNYYSFATTKNSPVGLGFLSKFPIISTSKEVINGVKTRPILIVNIDLGGENLRLITAHFPAYRSGEKFVEKFNKKAKYVVADHMIKIVKNLNKKTIIMGDLNSKFGRGFLLNDILCSNNSGCDGKFYNLWEECHGTQQECKSHTNGKIDHIILSGDLIKNPKINYKKGSFKVFKDKANPSDHDPIVMTLNYDGKLIRSNFKKEPEITKTSKDISDECFNYLVAVAFFAFMICIFIFYKVRKKR